MCFSTCWWSSVQRCGHVIVGVRASCYPGHSLGLVILFITVGLLCPMWFFFAVLHLDHSRAFHYPLPLLLLKPCSSPHKTTFFLSFPHSLIESFTHLPLILPFIFPLSSWYPQPSHTRVLLLEVHLQYVFFTYKHLN